MEHIDCDRFDTLDNPYNCPCCNVWHDTGDWGGFCGNCADDLYTGVMQEIMEDAITNLVARDDHATVGLIRYGVGSERWFENAAAKFRGV